MVTCDWFLRCNNEATKQVEHPTIGWVNICDRCLDWLGDKPSMTKMVPPLVTRKVKEGLH